LILHFGGVSTEQSFEAILGPNFRGAFHIYEAARREGARVVFPSSVHAVGLYERTAVLDQDCPLRPDGHYGLSKAYGELLARMYWEKHAVESVLIRIGSVLPEAPDERILSTWISHDDFVRLIQRSAEADQVGCSVVWGASNNRRSFWRKDARRRIGWAPLDSSDDQAERVRGRVTDDPVAERYQGGKFVSVDFTRRDFAPSEMFPRDD
jgi:uronate dehydrogenase